MFRRSNNNVIETVEPRILFAAWNMNTYVDAAALSGKNDIEIGTTYAPSGWAQNVQKYTVYVYVYSPGKTLYQTLDVVMASSSTDTTPNYDGIQIDAGGGDDTIQLGINVGSLGNPQILLPCTVAAAGGNDTIWGGANGDLLSGGNGNDLIDDSTTLTNGDTIEGGAGIDTLQYSRTAERNYRHFVNMVGSVVENYLDGSSTYFNDDTLYTVENVTLPDGGLTLTTLRRDTIWGSIDDNVFITGDGDDNVDAGAGDDAIYGLNCADTLSGGANNDSIFGGNGADSVVGSGGNDSLRGEKGPPDTLRGGAGDDILRDTWGTTDILSGDTGADQFYSIDDSDTPAGDDDKLYGGGADTLVDVLLGKDANDDWFDNGNWP
jgi:Ca2+-binding RTX toxin-like protein